MTSPYLVDGLKRDEGLRLEAYPDPLTGAAPWTIGYGHTGPEVHVGMVWTEAQADNALASDIARVIRALDASPLSWWRHLTEIRQDVLANMAFNMGVHGLMGFKNTLAFAKAGEYEDAAMAMLDSSWAKQVGARAQRLAMQMRTGVVA